MTRDIDADIRAFLKWFDRWGGREGVFTGGILFSPGCDPLPQLPDPGCCSEHVDLQALADSLRDLTSAKP